jgi:hypothetical protein
MFRIAVRNVLILLGVALPVLLVSAMLFGWLADGGTGRPSLDELVASLVFVYAMWVLPALGVGAIHQLLLATLPRDWNARTTRLVIIGTSLALAGLIAAYVGSASTLERGWRLALALLPSAFAYGALVQPLRARHQE